MAIVTTDNQYYSDIAAAIRKKLGVNRQYRPDEMAAAIESISTSQGIPVTFNGNPVVATDTIADQPFAGLKIYGKTVQDEAAGLVSAGEGGSVEIGTSLNLFDVNNIQNGYITDSGSVTTNASWVYNETELPVLFTTITVCKNSSDYFAIRIVLYNELGFQSVLDKKGTYSKKFNIDIPAGTTKIKMNWCIRASGNYVDLSGLRAFWGENDLVDETYQTPQSISMSTPSGLLGVPVSSGGNCIDSTGQAFTSDYWDFGAGLQHILCGKISSYNGEEITTPYISSTGSLTTGAKVVYVLPEPQTQPIPTETLAAYHALTTYAGTTVISTAEPVAGMEATVYCDAGATVQRLQGEIQTLSHTNTQLSRTVNTLPDAE